MNSKRLYLLLIGAVVLLSIASVIGVYYGQKTLEERNTTLNSLKAQSQVLEDQERALVQAKKEIEEYKDLESIARSVVPQEKDQSRTVRELVAIASQNGVTIGGVSFPSSDLGDKPDPKAKTQGSGTLSQVEPVDGIPGLYQLNATVNVPTEVTYSALISFLSALEKNRRTSAISSITITPSADNSSLLTFTLNLNIFIKP